MAPTPLPALPAAAATPRPTVKPTVKPTAKATVKPKASPTPHPTVHPSAAASPTPKPSTAPSLNPDVPGQRTYSRNVQPITAGQGCRSCHATIYVGTLGQDRANMKNISKMAKSNGTRAGLSAQQIADIQAWVAANGPDDSHPF